MGETSMPVGTCTAYRAQLTAGSRVRSTSELLAELEHGRVTFHAPASPRRQLEAVCRARCRCSGTPGWCAVVPMTSCPRVSSRFTGVCVCGDCGSGFEPRPRGRANLSLQNLQVKCQGSCPATSRDFDPSI